MSWADIRAEFLSKQPKQAPRPTPRPAPSPTVIVVWPDGSSRHCSREDAAALMAQRTDLRLHETWVGAPTLIEHLKRREPSPMEA